MPVDMTETLELGRPDGGAGLAALGHAVALALAEADGGAGARAGLGLVAALDDLRRALGTAGHGALAEALHWIRANLQLGLEEGRPLGGAEREALGQLGPVLAQGLRRPLPPGAAQALLDFLALPAWPLQASREGRLALGEALVRDAAAAASARPDEAEAGPGLAELLAALGEATAALLAEEGAGAEPYAACVALLAQLEALALVQDDAPLARIWAQVARNLALEDAPARLADRRWLLPLLDLPVLLAARLEASPQALDDDEALVACLADESWPLGLDAAAARVLLNGESQAAPAPGNAAAAPAGAAAEAPASVSTVDPEHLAMLAGEAAHLGAQLMAELQAAHEAGEVPAAGTHACGELLQRHANAAEAIGLPALAALLSHAAARLHDAPPILAPEQVETLAALPRGLVAYLCAPTDPGSAGALVDLLVQAGPWLAPPAALASRWSAALQRVALVRGADAGVQRPLRVEPVDVSLALPDDIEPELLQGLLVELPQQCGCLTAAIRAVAAGRGTPRDLNDAKRAAHTLKGAANTVGVRGIARLTHYLEDILIGLTAKKLWPPRALADVLSRAGDCLEAMSEALLGAGEAPADAVEVLQEVLDWIHAVDRMSADTAQENDWPGASAQDPAATSVAPAASAPAAAPTITPAAAPAMLRVPATLVDELLRLVGETMIANSQIKEQLRLSREHALAVKRQDQVMQQLTGELEHLVDIRGLAAGGPAVGAGGAFDALEFERYGELHTLTRRLVEAAADARDLVDGNERRLGNLSELIDAQGRLHLENQDVVMRTRRVPVETIVGRLQRTVRQTCRETGKAVELEVRGAATALDSQVLAELVDPLMHILRNAVDHGIEDAATRAARGKSATGRIELAFAREGAAIVIRCADDGSGLDLASIRARAEQLGLVRAGEPLGDEALGRLILAAGLSTRSTSSEVSGRGIGMDAVQGRIAALKGTLRLANRPGQGLGLELRLPATLMTTQGLLIRHAGRMVVASDYGVQDLRYIDRTALAELGAGLAYHDGERLHELVALADLLGEEAPDDATAPGLAVVMVQLEDGSRRAIRVEAVVECREIVVKPLGRYVARPAGVLGVTILGDGSMAPVLDLPRLVQGAGAAQAGAAPVRPAAGAAVPRRHALVVDDSLTARTAAARVARSAGFEVHVAADGVDALSVVDRQRPDLVLVDMEMPRMDGLELTARLRSRAQTRAVPIVMITSRSSSRHRELAQGAGVDAYFIKPFDETALLEQIAGLSKPAGK
jgi:chemosensory pili system protein ChpA (sensor histidine kinase/response regulator)